MSHEVEEDAAEKFLCHACVGETYLSQEICKVGISAQCSYCGEKNVAVPIEDIADHIDVAFESHYVRTHDQPLGWQQSLLSDRESNYEWGRAGLPVVDAIATAAMIEEGPASDIQEILEDRYSDFDRMAMGEETPFSSETYYEERATSDFAWQEAWEDFDRSLRTEARFFSRTAAAHLAAVFDGIEDVKTSEGEPLVISAGPGSTNSSFYRARVFQADEPLEKALCRPDLHLGPPPAQLAAAGRMNARGISVFYGSNDPKAAIAEVRPPVGSKVAVARFDIITPLRLLDLTALGNAVGEGSIFDTASVARMERARFLRSLSMRMTRPVMPDDEAFAYLPTQAIADFLATEAEPALDGILFPSVQVSDGKLNAVLFHKSARVEALDLPAGTEIHAGLSSEDDEGTYPDYQVFEEIPDAPAAAPTPDPFFTEAHRNSQEDELIPALRIAVNTVQVHHLRRVEYFADVYDVDRTRLVKSRPEF